MARNQLDNTKLEVFRDISDDVEESDFVPYACLFDPNTILTKNGELLQIIKITGFTYEVIEHEDADLREVIRRAVMESIPSNAYACWFTTIRRKKNLSPDGVFPDPFSQSMHDAWKERNQWDRKFINELYVTIVREGENADITSLKGFFNGLWAPLDRRQRNAFLDASGAELNKTAETMLQKLASFGAHRLGIVERDGRYYGEHLEFLEKLINLEERPMPIAEIGLSDYLTSGEISFAYNAMEVRSADGDRRFGAVMTIKEYKEASLYRLDEFLQIPCEFIVTQCLDFVNARQALATYQEQRNIYRISGARELAESSELGLILRDEKRGLLAYGEQQTTIFAIGTSIAELESAVKQIRESLSKIGIIAIREDIRFEDTYWAKLPANFEFLARLSYINTQHVAGFANLQNYPAGNAKGCPWGPPVSVFYTAAGTPYFFNFHLGNVGHTTLVGPYGSGKSVLLNFLLSESRKFQTRLFYLDARGHAQAFVEAIGGNYFDIANPQAPGFLAPLSLPDAPANREFLALWLTTLIDPSGAHIDDGLRASLREQVDAIFAHPAESRSLSIIASALSAAFPQASQALSRWCDDGEWAHLFDHVSESVQPGGGVIGFNLSSLMHDPALRVPVASYLLHRITMTCDGTPSIMVLDEAWKLLDSPLFSSRVSPWLQHLSAKNAIAIMTTEELEHAISQPFSQNIMQEAVTQIFLPDDEPDEALQDAFALTDEEFAYLDAMSVEYRHFMLKRVRETIIAELNLGGMDELLAVLSGNTVQKDNSYQPEVEIPSDQPADHGLAMHYEDQG